jgi:putative ABC transport system permease protein
MGPVPSTSMRNSEWRQAWRSLRRRPAFLAAAVLTLAFGTGITTAVFALVDTVLIRPLPYPDADRLVAVYETSPSGTARTSLIAPGRLDDWHRRTRSFVAISGSYAENVTDTSGETPERLEGRRVAPQFFDVYAAPLLAGRSFTTEEEAPNGSGAAVISEGLWTRRFQRRPSAVGHALTIGGRPYVIVGVMPSTFTSASTDVWLPAQTPPGLMQVRNARFFSGIGRIRPGVTLEMAAQDLVAVQEALGREHPATDADWSAQILALKDVRIGNSRSGLVLVFGAVLALWTIAVANIAGLTLVQVNRRTREMAVRSALGASRARVIGTVVREGMLIAITGGTAGAAIAAWLIAVMPSVLARTPRINELALDWRALAFVAIAMLAGGLAFSLVPAIAGTRADVNRLVSSSGRIAAGRHRLQQSLVIGQVALSVLLVGSATLLLRSYYNLAHVDTGFDASNVVTFHVGARWDEDRTRIGQLQSQLLSRLEELPHVQAAGMTNFLPATGATLRYQVRVDGLAGPNPDGTMTVGTRMIGGGYLRAIRAPLLAGAFCPAAALDGNAPLTALVNRQFVDVHAPGQDLAGRTIRMVSAGNAAFTITGVIGNLAEDSHASSPVPYLYTCNRAGAWPDPEYVVRTTDARTFTADLRRITREIDPARALFGLRPLQEVLDAALDQPRLDAAMLGLFAAAALLLAALGLYSLFMLLVADRARELAVRLAVGASPQQVVRLVLAGAGRLLALGIVLGVALTAAADRVLRGVLFAVSPLDVPALGAAVLILAVVAAFAVTGPALRAARIAPVDALRAD